VSWLIPEKTPSIIAPIKFLLGMGPTLIVKWSSHRVSDNAASGDFMNLIIILVVLLLLFGGGGYYMGPGIGYYGGGGISIILLIVILFLVFGNRSSV
jgi:hypothetical protein